MCILFASPSQTNTEKLTNTDTQDSAEFSPAGHLGPCTFYLWLCWFSPSALVSSQNPKTYISLATAAAQQI